MSVVINPFPQTELTGNQFSVTINGQNLPLLTAFVSAMPYNRRWPGYQRPAYQREEVNFGTFAMDAPVEITVRPTRSFRTALIRPLSLGIQPKIEDGVITFTLPHPAYFTVELDGFHNALHLFADPVINFAADPASADVLYFGPGVHETDTLELHSGQTVFIDEGAVVYCKGIIARNADNIRILGRGILDNSRNTETILWDAPEDGTITEAEAIQNAVRTHFIQLEACKNVLIEGPTLRDSLSYNIRPVVCTDLTIRHVKLIGNWRYNSDGIDMHNCRNVRISDSFIRTFDDCICAKGFDCYGDFDLPEKFDVFDGLTVERCVLWNDWNCVLEIGAETRAEEICNITWRDCDIIHATTSMLDIQNVDQAEVHHWLAENIRCEFDELAPTPAYQWRETDPYEPHFENHYQPFLFSASITYHHEYSESKERRGRIHDVTLRNIQINGSQKPILRFFGYDQQHLCENVTIDGIWRNGNRLSAEDLDIRMNEFTDSIHYL